MGISSFINDVKEKRVNNLTNEEKIKWLGKKKLDEYTLDLIVKDLKLDVQNNPNGFEFIPSEYKRFSQKQNIARMLAGQFVYGDQIKDINNFMNYTYCENRATNEFGFEGTMDIKTVEDKNLKEVSITLPEKLFDTKIHSFEDAFRNTSHIKIDLDIKTKEFSMNDMFDNAGIIHVPNFKEMDANIIYTEFCGGPESDGSWYYDTTYVGEGEILNTVKLPNIPLQEKVNFMVDHFNEHDDNQDLSVHERNKILYRQRAAHSLAGKYFGLSEHQQFITSADLNKIQKVIDLYQSNYNTKITHLAQIASDAKKFEGEFEKNITEKIMNELGIKTLSMSEILPKYLETKNVNDINIDSVDVVTKGNKESKLYRVITDDKIGIIYNPQKNEFDVAGRVESTSSIYVKDKYLYYDFESVPKNEYNNIINNIRLKNSELSNDILENENLSVPENNTEENEQEI